MTTRASTSTPIIACAICTDDILPGAIVSKLNCNHEYHRDCLQPWLDANHNTCPLDRSRITSINSIPLEQPEIGNDIPVMEYPLIEAQALYQRNIRVIQNPSIHSADPVERMAAKTQAVIFNILGR